MNREWERAGCRCSYLHRRELLRAAARRGEVRGEAAVGGERADRGDFRDTILQRHSSVGPARALNERLPETPSRS